MQFYPVRSLLLTAALLLASACGGTPPEANSGEHAAQTSPANFSEQVALGADLYGARCSKCHGKAGEGTATAPAVVGASALPLDPPPGAKHRTTRFVTVADVAAFVTKNMPADAPASLTGEEYYSVLAFDLKANGIDLGDQKLDAALAASLTIPR